ncbi:PREDICTED: LOW QUALITY PROTEIN: claspin [Chaetura pelagica]|uniref:LOW QUALITY PROTEIN: claspin n=1 Tax=Chaetura pelagica TaxID=8897 RepID=UPI000523BB33|nr:PREDICTED: LOW QUALITY PROTEIN: claspin [Chaetura pelagica]
MRQWKGEFPLFSFSWFRAAPPERPLPLEDVDSALQKGLDSDSDSGQGSCQAGSPGGCSQDTGDRDSEEEIFVCKKAKGKKVLEDSESEDGEDGSSSVQNDTLGGDKENEEEKENITALGKKKSRWIQQGLLDSDDSDSGDQLQTENLDTSRMSGSPEEELEEERPLKSGKQYRKHEQRKQKERKIEFIKQLKKEKKPRAEVCQADGGERLPLNDSGCLLDDKELFDNGLEEEDDSPPEDEESIESIRAAVKSKIKKHKNKERFPEGEGCKHVFEEEEPALKEPKRKERKAARLSKEAIKQLHSETQRLIRESSVSLPYHVPEAKSVHDFYKRRPRPAWQGNAMALLKSTKYQLPPTEEPADTKNVSTDCKDGKTEGGQSAANEAGTSLGRDVDTTVNKPLADVGENLTEDSDGKPRQDSDDSSTVRTAAADGDSEESSNLPSTDCGEEQENEIPLAAEGGVLEQRDQTAPDTACEKSNQGGPGLVPQPEKVKKSKLDKLRELGIDLSIQPRICSDNQSFINLDESDSNKELEALKARFLKHTLGVSKSKGERTINMNIVRKETTSEGKDLELQADVVPAVLAAESLDETAHTKPGEKLQALKAKLQEAMKLRRTEERQKRQALFKLDNEDMLEEEEEEEEEMTDESEEEEEGNENMEFLHDEAEEDNEETEEKHLEDGDKETDKESVDGEKLEKSVHCDSVPKPPSTESTLMLFKDSSSKMGYSLPDEKLEMEEAADKGPTKLEYEDSFSLPTLAKESSHNSSFELIGSMIPSYQPCNKQMSRGGNFLSAAGGFRSPSPGFFKTSFISSASKSSGKTSEPSLPIEDSQDLYNASPEPKSLFPGAGESQFQFSLEDDTQSQLLDADGFLNVGQHRNKYQSSKHQLTLASMDENAMDANMDELLDLCSGKFSSQAEHVPSTSSHKKQNMEELLNLCSGKFVTQSSPTWASSISSKAEKDSDTEDPMAEALALCSGSFPTDREEEDEEEQEELGDFQLVTDDNAFDSEEDKKNGDSDAEEAETSDEEEQLLRYRQGLKKKLRLQDFMEEEAELSGSDVGSEDEYDGEDLNEYEEEIIDEELPNEEELENQIQKFHMKAMLDDDKRQLRLYQERYLLDGDLHSDGPGRMRRFRWKNIDYASQMDLFQRDSDNDDENEQFDETEAKWRKERFEREQWLREQKEKNIEQEEEEEIGEDSQFMKLAKKVTAKSLERKASPAVVVQDTTLLPRNPFETFRPASDIQIKSGSLLSRPRAVLQKLAAMSDLNPNAPRNSRNFVFHTLSPDKSEEAKEKSKLQVRKRGPAAAVTPLAKRPRVDSTEETSQSRSIFQYLES